MNTDMNLFWIPPWTSTALQRIERLNTSDQKEPADNLIEEGLSPFHYTEKVYL